MEDLKDAIELGYSDELKDIQLGQIVIFCSEDGIRSNHILIYQYISSLSGKLCKESTKTQDKLIIFIRNTDKEELWDKIACKIASAQDTILELSDSGSLMEMLYDYYGIPYDKSRIKMPDRHHITPSDYHPLNLGCIVEMSPAEAIHKKVLKALWEAQYNKDKYGVDYDLEQIIKDFEAEKDKEYKLEIVPEQVKSGKGRRTLIDCHLYMTDENGERSEIMLKAQQKAVYLLFLLYKDGIALRDFDRNKSKEPLIKIYTLIQDKLKGHNYIEEPTLTLTSTNVNSIRNKIRTKISDISKNLKYIQDFSIEGPKEKPFKIEAGTQEHRDLIRKTFMIE